MRLGESSSLDDEEEEGSKLLGMISNLKLKDILMPRFDPEMKSGRVVEWLKKEGERVKKGEPVVRIDTEKVSLDVESPESGTLAKILVIRLKKFLLEPRSARSVSKVKQNKLRLKQNPSLQLHSLEFQKLRSPLKNRQR